jgi:phosphohistidine swiveling domain-containing protein
VALGALCEIATPRIEELADELVGEAAPPEALMWDLTRARGRQQDALAYAHAKAGFLGRSGMKKAISLTQTALITHAKARDALAYVLAAARHWAKAAADEGMTDGRIHAPDEIFMLEIEEIKQMMTGEWHSRDHVEPLIAGRRQTYEQTAAPVATASHPLGVAGSNVQGTLQKLSSPDDVQSPAGFIALAESWGPAWWRVLLMAEGVIATNGNLLSWIASVARMGDLPALTGGTAYADWPAGVTVTLDPDRHQAEQID